VGKGKAGYWDSKDLAIQFSEMLQKFKEKAPLATLHAIFDNATSHSVFSDDALLAEKFNKKTGLVKNKKWLSMGMVRDGYYYDGEIKVVQKMESKDGEGKRTRLGILDILKARKVEMGDLMLNCVEHRKRKTKHSNGVGHDNEVVDEDDDDDGNDDNSPIEPQYEHSENGDCCFVALLSKQPDFVAQKNLLTEMAEKFHPSYRVWFLPKYHCELNPIERGWKLTKDRTNEQALQRAYMRESISVNEFHKSVIDGDGIVS